MAKKNSAVLWTVGQSLAKGDKEQARHNMGISFESSSTLTTKTLTFVDNIKEDPTTGDLTFTKNSVTVDKSVNSSSDNPISNSAVSTALNNLKVFYATTSTTFDQLKTAYDAGRTLVLVNSDLAYPLNGVTKTSGQPTKFLFTNPYISESSDDHDGTIFNKFVRLDSWYCESNGWTHGITARNIVCQDYCDYRVGVLQTVGDIAIATGDKLLISDSSDNGKEVRSGIAFDTTASETSFLNERGAWNTALPTYTESTDPLANNYWDTLSGTKFYTIKNSPTPASNNTSPEGGNMFALTGEFDRGSGNKYKVQLAMGDKLYYRHTTGTAGTTWSDWKCQFEGIWEYGEVTASSIYDLTGIKLLAKRGSAIPYGVRKGFNADFIDPLYALVFRPYADSWAGKVLTAKYDPNMLDTDGSTGCGYFDWEDPITYTAGVDLKLTGTEFAVDTNSTIDTHSDLAFVIGDSNSIEYGRYSFAYGYHNECARASSCVVGGYYNTIHNHTYGFIFGGLNKLGETQAVANVTYGTDNIIFGKYNEINKGSNNILLGISNNINVGNTPPTSNDYPLRNILIGSNNSIGCNSVYEYGHDAILIGKYLNWSDPSCSPLVLGLYNSSDWRYKSDGFVPLRITGCGLDEGVRRNVEVMYSDGLIWSFSGFEVSGDLLNQHTYTTRIYREVLPSDIESTTGSGIYSKHVETDVMSASQTLTYNETAQMTNTFLSISAAKLDSASETPKSPSYLHAISNILLSKAAHISSDPGRREYEPALELSSSAFGGNVGLTMGEAALPSWNVQDAESTSNISVTWLKLYGNRNAAKDNDGNDVLPSDPSVPLGNLEVGKLAVRFYKETDLTIDKPLIPGQKVGDISFVVGDPTTNNHGFYVYDYYQGPGESTATPQTHKTSYINNGYHFCMLMTVTPSTFDSNNHLATPGSFCVLS